MHYLDEGPAAASPVLLLHGEPSWCYLYRKMISILVAAGHRCIAPDLLGFGRSDKPIRREDYTVQLHIDALTALIKELDLTDITLVGQDWGGILGLRISAENESRFARICIGNTGLPTGEQAMSEAFDKWKAYSQKVETFGRNGSSNAPLPWPNLPTGKMHLPQNSPPKSSPHTKRLSQMINTRRVPAYFQRWFPALPTCRVLRKTVRPGISCGNGKNRS